MDCKGFQKYVGAFADGELEVQQNLEALEHLNMCPACAARVNAVTSLKAVLKRAYEPIHAPEHVRERVRQALAAETGQPGEASGRPLRMRFRPLPTRLAVPLGMAAGLLLVVGAWQLWSRNQQLRTDVLTVVPGHVVADVRAQHRYCIGHRAGDHYDGSLSRDLPVIAERLSAQLDMKVIAPDLAGLGFELVGADSCGIKGRPGAHVMYRSQATAKLLSVFSMARLPGFDAHAEGGRGGRGFFVSRDKDQVNVVAWNDGPQTYVLCADLPEPVLLEIGGRVSGATASAWEFYTGRRPSLAMTAARATP